MLYSSRIVLSLIIFCKTKFSNLIDTLGMHKFTVVLILLSVSLGEILNPLLGLTYDPSGLILGFIFSLIVITLAVVYCLTLITLKNNYLFNIINLKSFSVFYFPAVGTVSYFLKLR